MSATLSARSFSRAVSPAEPQTPPPTRWPRRGSGTRPWAPALIVVAVCGLGTLAVLRDGWTGTDDGAGVVPIVALISIGLAGARWRPGQSARPVRPVSSRLSLVVNAVAASLTALIVGLPAIASDLIGPVVSLALFGSYLALWGYRALALLRTVTLLSFLTWEPAAAFVHAVVRSSLEQPSNLVYRRLARLPLMDIADEPWRLFSAELHRGSLVVIATLTLGVGANRWRVSARTAVDLLLAASAALTMHHLIILTVSIDQYEPSDVTQLATNPTLELAISMVAVAVLSGVRFWRDRRRVPDDQRAAEHQAAANSAAVLEARDPVIFTNANVDSDPLVTALLLTSMVPLVALGLVG